MEVIRLPHKSLDFHRSLQKSDIQGKYVNSGFHRSVQISEMKGKYESGGFHGSL